MLTLSQLPRSGALLVALALVLGACGQKGPLYHPAHAPAEAPAEAPTKPAPDDDEAKKKDDGAAR